MKHLKRYNESVEEEFFSDETLKALKDILVEYTDIDITYSMVIKGFKRDSNYYFPITTGWDPREQGFDMSDDNKRVFYPNDVYKGYQISFGSMFNDSDICTTDVQRGDNKRFFGLPNDRFYKFFEITKDVQHTIESMGYIFLLSTHKHGEFDIMVIEKK